MFSPSVLTLILAQSSCGAPLRRTLVERFFFESSEWLVLDRMRLPEGIPATRDPVLLALRRLVRRDFSELPESHRLVAESAETRPCGLLHLIFEEVVLLSQLEADPGAERCEALRIFFEALNVGCPGEPHPWELFELRARGAAQAVGHLSALPAPFSLAVDACGGDDSGAFRRARAGAL